MKTLTQKYNERQKRIDEMSEEEKDREDERLALELEDVFSEMFTPDVSEDEVETKEETDTSNVFLNRTNPQSLFNKMMTAKSDPHFKTSYALLYANPKYRTNIKRKMLLLRKTAAGANIEEICKDPNYFRMCDVYYSQYPNDGGREGLYYLIGLFNYINNSDSDDDDETDSNGNDDGDNESDNDGDNDEDNESNDHDNTDENKMGDKRDHNDGAGQNNPIINV